MKCVQRVAGLLFLLAVGCGGSSSETPMPLEPVPHVGPPRAGNEPQRSPAISEDVDESPEGNGHAESPVILDGASPDPSSDEGVGATPSESAEGSGLAAESPSEE